MESKKIQRQKYLELRQNIDYEKKENLDLKIYNSIIESEDYKSCSNILTYVSNNFEVDTLKIIDYSIKQNKTVYAPFITKEKRIMKFYKVSSIDALIKNKFEIFEPEPIEENSFNYSDNSICLVPALVFDYNGYRIGYGGGYYDVFLSKYEGKKIGVVYDDFIINKVNIDEFDISVDKIITNKRIFNIF